jgi:hypothetical protein
LSILESELERRLSDQKRLTTDFYRSSLLSEEKIASGSSSMFIIF